MEHVRKALILSLAPVRSAPSVAASSQCQTQTHTQNCQRMHLLIGVIFVLSVGTSCGFSIDFTSNETAVIDGIFRIVTQFFGFS
jgi:hypothetical protein